jgi:peptide/nickel transport system ATP-binding protein
LRRCNYKLASRKTAEAIIDRQKLKAVGLTYEEFAGKYPNEFSGGQLQRISIARALLTNPKLLIADEPVSMVDASLRMSIVNLFKKLSDELGVSVLYITHDLATAYYVSDRIAIMFRGNIVEMGTVEQVLMNPRHPYTRLLRDSIPRQIPKNAGPTRFSLTELEQEEYLRKGCKFAGRCPLVMDICKLYPEGRHECRLTKVCMRQLCRFWKGDMNVAVQRFVCDSCVVSGRATSMSPYIL